MVQVGEKIGKHYSIKNFAKKNGKISKTKKNNWENIPRERKVMKTF